MGEANPRAVELSRDFKEKAKGKYNIEKIILFGSQVAGSPKEGSDIDLLVVSDRIEDKAQFMSRLFEEWHITQKKNFPVDFVCFTPGEFSKLASKTTIVKQAVEEGIEI